MQTVQTNQLAEQMYNKIQELNKVFLRDSKNKQIIATKTKSLKMA